MDEDSVLALEQAVHQIDCESESSDSEVDPGEEEGRVDNSVTLERTKLARERLEGLYPSPTASSGTSQLEHERSAELERVLPKTSATPHQTLPANFPLNVIFGDGMVFLRFRQFLMDQCITRNLNFWMACQSFHEMDPHNPGLEQVALAIYMKFIKLSAPQHVTISDNAKKNIRATVMNGEAPVSPNLFDEAQKQIWYVMAKNELRQFLVSDRLIDCSASELSDLDLYTPSMANPAYGVCGGGSLQNSGSEDSASMTSFSTDSDAGARSAVFCRSLASGTTRRAMSDNEGSRPKKRVYPNPYIVEGKPVSKEEFALRVCERLQGVFQDREAMTLKARDLVRKQGKTYEEIMAAQWYDLPEKCKYLQTSDDPVQSRTNPVSHVGNKPSSHHIVSPLEFLSPSSTLCSGAKQKLPEHIKDLAKKEVMDALRDLQITNQVNRKRHSTRLTSGCSSVFSATSDSGVGDTWATSGIPTPTNHRLHAYLHHQNMISSRLPERDRDAQAAAIALISNSPHPDSLNPLPDPPIHQQHHSQHHQSHHSNDRHRRQNFGRYSSGDDSSSVFTMTSQSTTSDLFIPRKSQHYNTDSDAQNHYNVPSRVRRTLTTPKRSSHMRNSHAPPTISEQHRHLPPPSQQPPPPQRSTSHQSNGGDVLIVYNLDDLPTPYAKRLSGSEITLADFKERVFARKGDYRFFFKTFCEDLQMEILEEYTNERSVLPLVDGKIMGRVEKISA